MLTPSLSTATDYTLRIGRAILISSSCRGPDPAMPPPRLVPTGGVSNRENTYASIPGWPVPSRCLDQSSHSRSTSDVSTNLLTLDPLVLFDLLLLGPNNFDKRVLFATALCHTHPLLVGCNVAQSIP